MSGRSRTVRCIENVPIADFLCGKREDFRSDYPSKLSKTLSNACNSICDHPTPITSLADAKKVKNVGDWTLQLLKPFFDEQNASVSGAEPVSQNSAGTSGTAGQRGRAKRKYCPKKGSAAYAILITLLRAQGSGKEFMKKNELLDTIEESGLADGPMRPRTVGYTGGPPNVRDFYSGWSGMKTLIEKLLVAKSSNPAKYMLTQEGKALAEECIKRSTGSHGTVETRPVDRADRQPWESSQSLSAGAVDLSSDEDVQEMDRYDVNQRSTSHSYRPQIDREVAAHGASQPSMSKSARVPPLPVTRTEAAGHPYPDQPGRIIHTHGEPSVQTSSAVTEDRLPLPPLNTGEKFADVYDVVCILDRRERFGGRPGSTSTLLPNMVQGLGVQFNVQVEARQLPVGDALWIARHKRQGEDYVLDFVVERKQVDDLWTSIKDNRYKQQKLRLQNCGLKRLFYLVEGDVNRVESTEALKTAMFTTELQGGFYVLRTTDTADTCRQYGHLTLAISSRYAKEVGDSSGSGPGCMTYNEFIEHCKDLEKDRVGDVFCLQLTQINQVTELVARSIQDRYPTLMSLALAYKSLGGNRDAEEKLLQGIPIRNSKKCVTPVLSKKIHKAIWSEQPD